MMIKLMREDAFRPTEAVVKALKWVRLSYIRPAAALAAWFAALKALSRWA
ncbi:MAG: hypothetical protein K6T59_01840 [Bryobacteraceae bacterium]|nr:hypothetical protein [Bryobacteraceae bacterium]